MSLHHILISIHRNNIIFDISLVIQATESPHIGQAFTCDEKKKKYSFICTLIISIIYLIIQNYHHGLSVVEEQVKCSRKTSSTSSFLSSGQYHKHIVSLTNLHNFCLFLLQLAVTQSLAAPEAADRTISLEGI